MLRNRKGGSLALCWAIVLGAALLVRPAKAANITLSGTIGTDDAVQLFDFTVTTASSVDLRSYGYAGGTTSTSMVVLPGGFDTVLTLFDASGQFLSENDDGASVAPDPTTGLAADAQITQTLMPGGYILALTQYDNFSRGNLADVFSETGNPNFTADPSFTSGGSCAGNLFRDISGTAGRCRNGNWTVDFTNVASVTPAAPVPEPSALLLAGVGLALLLAGRPCRRKIATLWAVGLVVMLANIPLEAQTNCPPVTSGPDYCHVSDFLNGNRTFFQDQDIVISVYNPIAPPPGVFHSYVGATAVVLTANGVTTGQPALLASENITMSDDRIQRPFAGRLYASPHDQYLTVIPTVNAPYLLMQDGGATKNLASFPAVKLGAQYTTFSAVMADFNGDGYADLAVNFGPGDELGDMVVFSGADSNGNFSPHYGPVHGNDDPNGSQQETLLAMTAGDFYGDGRHEIAGLAYKRNGQYTLCIYAVDPTTLAITKVSEFTPDYSAEPAFSSIPVYSLTAGNLNSEANQQLVYAYATGTGRNTKIAVFDFSHSGNALSVKELTIYDTRSAPRSLNDFIQVQAARFDPTSGIDLIAFLFAWQDDTHNYGSGTKYIRTLSLNADNTLTANPTTDFSEAACVSNMTVGNFDKKTTVNGVTQAAFTKQIGFITSNCTPGSTGSVLFILGVSADGKTYTPDQENYRLPDEITSRGGLFLTAGDIQGRSFVLGEPTKITINSTLNPNVIVSAPPMHVDFISPAPLSGAAPVLFNLSAVPDAFNTTYDQESSSGTTTGATNKTSWSFGAKESLNGYLQVGNPEEGEGLKVSDTFTAAQNLKGAAEKTHTEFSQKTFHLTTTTGLGDQVVFTDSQFNIWVYPVLGKTVCPVSNPNCSQAFPLTVQFSAPNGDAKTTNSPGASLPWYQPPWEPGNIFSYPANAAQLKALFPNLTPLTNAVTFASTSGSVTEQATWSNQSQNDSSASFDQDYSFDNDFSVTGAIGISGITAGGGYGLDLSGSYGLSTLSQTSNQIAASTGLKIQVPGTFANFANYGYLVSPSIMGTAAGPNVVDSPPNTSSKTSVDTYGRLVALYTVDPLNNNQGAGVWWRQAYTSAPDVALNHPKRWTFTATSLVGAPPSNCLAIGSPSSQYDCVTLNAPAPSDPLGDDFHVMRGFFIARANAQNQNFQNQGPQLELAKTGDVLNLSARVYNYSLAAMPPGTQVHARFYYMLWDTTRAQPVDPQGASTLINEVTTGPIPKFDTSSDALNSVLMGTQFNTGDTTKFPNLQGGNVTVVFWVLAWMQDGSGNLIQDLPNHGLTKVPPAFTSWMNAANFECPSTPNNSCYSNNLGLYPSPFYIANANLDVPPNPLPGSASVDIGKLDVSASQVGVAEQVTLSATVSAEGADVGTMSVNFYAGDPTQGGQLFDVERIAYIAQSSGYKVTASYRPNTCGTHELFAVINEGQSNEVVRRAPPVRVDCSGSATSKLKTSFSQQR